MSYHDELEGEFLLKGIQHYADSEEAIVDISVQMCSYTESYLSVRVCMYV